MRKIIEGKERMKRTLQGGIEGWPIYSIFNQRDNRECSFGSLCTSRKGQRGGREHVRCKGPTCASIAELYGQPGGCVGWVVGRFIARMHRTLSICMEVGTYICR